MQVYLTNRASFKLPFPATLFLLIITSVTSAALLSLLLITLNRHIYRRAVVLLFMISVLMWIEGNIIVWQYGVLDGTGIEWNKYWARGIADGIMWFSFLIMAFKRSRAIYKSFGKVCRIILCIQFIMLSIAITKTADTPQSLKYKFGTEDICQFSSSKNVIILTLDSFQSDVFQEIIDEKSSYKGNFRGFTYFRNAVSGFGRTKFSLPVILTGSYYDSSVPIKEFSKKALESSSSLPKILKENGFRVELYPVYCPDSLDLDEEIAHNIRKFDKKSFIPDKGTMALLYDLALFRQSPHFFKKYIYNDQKWFLREKINKITFNKKSRKKTPKRSSHYLKNLSFDLPKTKDTKLVPLRQKPKKEGSRERPGKKPDPGIKFFELMGNDARVSCDYAVFKYIHLEGMHPPLRYAENLEYKILSFNRRNYKRQAKALLSIVNSFLNKLKEIGAYDNSLIIIIGDHGSDNLGVKIPQGMDRHGIAGSLGGSVTFSAPLILVKPFGAKGRFKVSDAPVCLSDIPKTVITQAGLKTGHPGLSMFAIKASKRRERRYLSIIGEKSNDDDYMPGTEEFVITGFSWFRESWRNTGRKFKPPKAKAYNPLLTLNKIKHLLAE